MPDSKLGHRVRYAFQRIHQREGRHVPLPELAIRLALRLGLKPKDAPTGPTVSRWQNGKATPDREWMQAIATEAGVDPGWLAYAGVSLAPEPSPLVGPGMTTPVAIPPGATLPTAVPVHAPVSGVVGWTSDGIPIHGNADGYVARR